MAVTLEITNDYGYVVLVLVLYIFFNFWMAIQVGKARRKYKVSYPTLYAIESENKDAKLFNCIQVRGFLQYDFFCPLFCFNLDPRSLPLFCCSMECQRGHQNALEMMPVFFVTLLLSGLYCPIVAAGLGAFYTVARYFYFRGYATGVPENRLKIGGFNFLALLGLMILAAVFGVRLLLS
ncbi:hypothetical protein ZIOFF_045430 [Zingiber officinale]|uniref:Microsomal glutathione S-transferase 3 n=1 Tax=Zingiber officinale TaxID=94328 RepID=A0A8J5KV98_ZINOF|nr:hypothetical protein ZIOFF_045430 [Zingiber officinale]